MKVLARHTLTSSNTTPSQHSAALMAVLKGTFKNTELQVAAGMSVWSLLQNQ